MIFIGERINTGFKDIKAAVVNKDGDPIKEWARKQTDAKADYLDVNLGAVSNKPEDMCWMIEMVQEEVDTVEMVEIVQPELIVVLEVERVGMVV